MRRPAVAFALCLVALEARAARAAPLSADIAATRGPGADDCPDRAKLVAAVEAILKRPVAVPAAADEILRVDVDFTREGDLYRAALRLRGAKQGERLLEDRGPTCSAIAEAAGVTLALLLDRELERPAIAPPAPPPPPAPAHADSPAEAPRRSRGWFSILAGPAFGLVPSTSVGVGAGIGLDHGPVWIEIAARHVAARSTPFGPGQVRVALTMGYVDLCGSLPLSGEALRASLCAHAAAGRIGGEGSGYNTSTSAGLAWIAAGGGPRIGGIVGGRWQWGLRGVALVPVRSQTFSVENVGVGYQTGSVGATIDLEIGVRIF